MNLSLPITSLVAVANLVASVDEGVESKSVVPSDVLVGLGLVVGVVPPEGPGVDNDVVGAVAAGVDFGATAADVVPPEGPGVDNDVVGAVAAGVTFGATAADVVPPEGPGVDNDVVGAVAAGVTFGATMADVPSTEVTAPVASNVTVAVSDEVTATDVKDIAIIRASINV